MRRAVCCLCSVPVLCTPGNPLDRLYRVIWEQQCLLHVSGELELSSVRKNSVSYFVFTLHSVWGFWEVSPCALWGGWFQSQAWEPKVKSSSAWSPQGTAWCLKAEDETEKGWVAFICNLWLSSPEDLLPPNREGVGEEEEQKRGKVRRKDSALPPILTILA